MFVHRFARIDCVAEMSPRKSRKCPVCRQVFDRPYNVTLHLKTAHREYVQKIVCSICKKLISLANLRVHLKRESKRNKKKYTLKNDKINGIELRRVYVPAKSLKHGRFYAVYDDDSSEYSETDEMPLARFIQSCMYNILHWYKTTIGMYMN